MKKILALALATTMALSLVSCSASKEAITIATGGTGGTYYPMGGSLATVLNESLEKSELSVASTGASKTNIFEITDNNAQLALVQNDVLSYAHSGTDLFAEDGAETSSLWVTSLYNETVQIIVSPEIESFEDLRGQPVNVGDVGSGNEFNSVQVLEAYGMTFDDIEVVNGSYNDLADAMKDGKVVGGIVTTGAPSSAMVDLATSIDFNMLTLSDEAMDYLLTNYSFYVQEDLPASVYSCVEEPVTTIAVKAALVASVDLSEDVVYEITKGIFENLDALRSSHAKFEYVSLETALDGASCEIHPGAIKYYEEVGIL